MDVTEQVFIDEIHALCKRYNQRRTSTVYMSIFECIAACPTEAVWNAVSRSAQEAILQDLKRWLAAGRYLPIVVGDVCGDVTMRDVNAFVAYQKIELLLSSINLLDLGDNLK